MDGQYFIDQAQSNTPPYGDMLSPALAGLHAGARVVVLANGPSASGYKRQPGDIVIACNNSLKLRPDADYWLVAEGGAYKYPWLWQYAGKVRPETTVVWDRFISAACNGHGGDNLLDAYGGAFLSRVIWALRHEVTDGFSIRSYLLPNGKQGGLALYRLNDEPVGTVTMQAIHLAGILGAKEVHLWGAEFYFPGGEQHADDWKPYTDKDGPCGLVRFELLPYEPPLSLVGGTTPPLALERDGGPYESTRLFLDSARALRRFIAGIANELPVIDHSAGLLSPGEMNGTGKVERTEDRSPDKASRAEGNGKHRGGHSKGSEAPGTDGS